MNWCSYVLFCTTIFIMYFKFHLINVCFTIHICLRQSIQIINHSNGVIILFYILTFLYYQFSIMAPISFTHFLQNYYLVFAWNVVTIARDPFSWQNCEVYYFITIFRANILQCSYAGELLQQLIYNWLDMI